MPYLALYAVITIWLGVLIRLLRSLKYQHPGTRDTLDQAIAYGHDFIGSGRGSAAYRASLVERCGGEEHQAVELFDRTIVGRCHIPTYVPVRYPEATIFGIVMATALITSAILVISLGVGTTCSLLAHSYAFSLADLLHLVGIAAGAAIFYRTRGVCAWGELVNEVRQRNGRQPLAMTPNWYARLQEQISSRRAEQGR